MKIEAGDFGAAVKKAREELGLSRTQLTEMTGVSYVTLAKLEDARPCDIRHMTFFTLCDHLGLDEYLCKIPPLVLERLKQGLSVSVAARKIGVSKDTLYCAESGLVVSKKTLKKIYDFWESADSEKARGEK